MKKRKCIWYRADMNSCKIDNKMCALKGCDAYEEDKKEII
jgi:hypothetical protein